MIKRVLTTALVGTAMCAGVVVGNSPSSPAPSFQAEPSVTLATVSVQIPSTLKDCNTAKTSLINDGHNHCVHDGGASADGLSPGKCAKKVGGEVVNSIFHVEYIKALNKALRQHKPRQAAIDVAKATASDLAGKAAARRIGGGAMAAVRGTVCLGADRE